MPELPDLEVFSGNLQKKLHGKTVDKVNVENSSKLKASASAFKKALEGEKLDKVYREGKELRFSFKNGSILGMHLMLHGKLYLFEGKNTHKNTIVDISFTDESGLALTDYQGMANISLNPEERDAPDALDLDLAYLIERLSKTRTAVKTLLLDQKVIRGIGNAYADEILYDAGISPFSLSNKIPDDKVKDLARSVKHILTDAIKQIKKSHPDIIAGDVRDFLKIHQHRNSESPGGAPILTKTAGGRKTYYTGEQVEYK